VNKSLEYQTKVCEENRDKIVICLDRKQRKRILRTLRNLNVPIFKGTGTRADAKIWPNLVICREHICGYLQPNGQGFTGYTELSERDFIGLFITNKFDIYGSYVE